MRSNQKPALPLDRNVVVYLLMFAGLQLLCSLKMLINSYISVSGVYLTPVRFSSEIKVCEDFLIFISSAGTSEELNV